VYLILIFILIYYLINTLGEVSGRGKMSGSEKVWRWDIWVVFLYNSKPGDKVIFKFIHTFVI
jgi:hypothetical protein